MFGCLRRVGCLVVLVIAGVVAWFARDLWWERATGNPARTVEWHGPASGPDRDRLADRLRRAEGEAFTTMEPGDLAAVLAGALGGLVSEPAVAITGDELRLRGRVNLAQLPQAGRLGPAAALLEQSPSLEIAGRPSVPAARVGRVTVTDLRVGGVQLPAAGRTALLAQLGRAVPTFEVLGDTIRFALPAAVADVRVARGRVTVYRSGS